MLYLDILGFSEMVNDPERVMMLYRIINDLNVHRDASFKAIVFSDTLIIYTDFQIEKRGDATFAVMFLCEFAQDLLFRTIGRNFFFRASIVFGAFKHERLANLEAYFGPALITAYRAEKHLKAVGLFIDEYSAQFCDIFKSRFYCQGFRFVYLTQGLDDLCLNTDEIWPHESPAILSNTFPIPPEIIEDRGLEFDLIKEIKVRFIVFRFSIFVFSNVLL